MSRPLAATSVASRKASSPCRPGFLRLTLRAPVYQSHDPSVQKDILMVNNGGGGGAMWGGWGWGQYVFDATIIAFLPAVPSCEHSDKALLMLTREDVTGCLYISKILSQFSRARNNLTEFVQGLQPSRLGHVSVQFTSRGQFCQAEEHLGPVSLLLGGEKDDCAPGLEAPGAHCQQQRFFGSLVLVL